MNKKDKLVVEHSTYDMEGTIENAIDLLQSIKNDMNSKGYNKVTIECELDYSFCYYESDTPTPRLIITGTKT